MTDLPTWVETPATRDFLKARHDFPPMGLTGTADFAVEELLALLAAEHEARVRAEEVLDGLDSYNGHLAWMDKHYPLDVSYFAESEDVGCQVMRLSRKVMQAESEVALRGRMLDIAATDYANRPSASAPTAIGRERYLADLRDRAGGVT